MSQQTLFRTIKYPTITAKESEKRKKALKKAIANDTDYHPDNFTNCERCGIDFNSVDNGFMYHDTDNAVVCNFCAWSRKDRIA